MTMLQQILSVTSASTVIMVLLMLIVGLTGKWLPTKLHAFVPLLAPVVVLLPIAGQPVYTYIRGAIGDLSMVSQGLILAIVLGKLFQKQLWDSASRKSLPVIITILGIILYPAALGLGPVDTYSLGYQGVLLPLLVLLTTFWLLHCRAPLASGLFSLAALMAATGAIESNNLWDYLIDPLLFIYMSFQTLKQAWRKTAL